MLGAFTKKYTDESTVNHFVFTFYCDVSDTPWESIPITFSRKDRLLTKLLGRHAPHWKKEHADAFERANNEAMLYFNRCPVCKRWVCDASFSEEDNCCSDCRCMEADDPKEFGEPANELES